ncbi:hypothetical protein BV22DRAFT_1024341, partial [Leucogyrophana mollusca]
HIDIAWSVAYFPDGQRIPSGSDDGTVRSDSEARSQTGNPLDAKRSIWSVAFSPDGGFIVCGGRQRRVFVGYGAVP